MFLRVDISMSRNVAVFQLGYLLVNSAVAQVCQHAQSERQDSADDYHS
jgi:hypothetical protein